MKKNRMVLFRPNHPNSDKNGNIQRSRYVMFNMINRPLKKGEVVHHRSRDKSDDRPENLQLFKNNSEHLRIKISLNDIKELVGNNIVNHSELLSRIMDKFGCSHMTADKAINKYIDEFEIWIERKFKEFPNKFLKNKVVIE